MPAVLVLPAAAAAGCIVCWYSRLLLVGLGFDRLSIRADAVTL